MVLFDWSVNFLSFDEPKSADSEARCNVDNFLHVLINWRFLRAGGPDKSERGVSFGGGLKRQIEKKSLLVHTKFIEKSK